MVGRPRNFANDHRVWARGQGSGSLSGRMFLAQQGSWDTLGNEHEVPAGPKSGTTADVCIMKKRLFFNRLNVEEQSIAGPFMRAPFGVVSPNRCHMIPAAAVTTGECLAKDTDSTNRVRRAPRWHQQVREQTNEHTGTVHRTKRTRQWHPEPPAHKNI